MRDLYAWPLNKGIEDKGKGNNQEEDAHPLQGIHSQKRPPIDIRLGYPPEEQEKREMPDIEAIRYRADPT